MQLAWHGIWAPHARQPRPFPLDDFINTPLSFFLHPAFLSSPLTLQESGHAREYITDECLLPCPTLKRWSTCNVVKDGKTTFRMYLDETHTRFMLSAKRVGDSFYISQYESFPDSVDDVPDLYYCAVLRTCSEGHFKLFLNGCEACDRKADKYTCGVGDRCDDRQLLAEINHVSIHFFLGGWNFF